MLFSNLKSSGNKQQQTRPAYRFSEDCRALNRASNKSESRATDTDLAWSNSA